MKTEQQQIIQANADIQRAESAKQLRNNTLLNEVLTSMKAAHFQEFEECAWSDDLQRRELAQRMKILSQFEGKIQAVIKQGDKAQTTLQMITSKVKSIIR